HRRLLRQRALRRLRPGRPGRQGARLHEREALQAWHRRLEGKRRKARITSRPRITAPVRSIASGLFRLRHRQPPRENRNDSGCGESRDKKEWQPDQGLAEEFIVRGRRSNLANPGGKTCKKDTHRAIGKIEGNAAE